MILASTGFCRFLECGSVELLLPKYVKSEGKKKVFVSFGFFGHAFFHKCCMANGLLAYYWSKISWLKTTFPFLKGRISLKFAQKFHG